MRNPVKILHIDSNYQAHYFIIQAGSSIHSDVSLGTAITLLKSVEFDLILSEPQNKAILKTAKEGNFIHESVSKILADLSQEDALNGYIE